MLSTGTSEPLCAFQNTDQPPITAPILQRRHNQMLVLDCAAVSDRCLRPSKTCDQYPEDMRIDRNLFAANSIAWIVASVWLLTTLNAYMFADGWIDSGGLRRAERSAVEVEYRKSSLCEERMKLALL